MQRIGGLSIAGLYLGTVLTTAASVLAGPVLKPDSFEHYVDSFNENDRELYKQQHWPSQP